MNTPEQEKAARDGWKKKQALIKGKAKKSKSKDKVLDNAIKESEEAVAALKKVKASKKKKK